MVNLQQYNTAFTGVQTRKGGVMMQIKRILFPHDFSENASKIVPYVQSMAKAYNSRIYVFHVVQDLQKWGKAYVPHRSMTLFEEEALKTSQKEMDRICEEEFQGMDNLERKVVSGDPASEILKTIESEDVDLVVIGTHGRKGLEHVIFGSVAENVVKKSTVPVMTVNPYKLK
jgi:nucleotide-binding universal stress UspA family protein